MSIYKTDASGDVKRHDRPEFVKVVSAATSLTALDNDLVIELNAAAGAQVDLPAVADIESGWNIKVFVGAAFATTDWTVVSATNVIQGHAIVAGAHVAAADENTISFVASAEGIGDFVDIRFNGTNFIVFGSGVASGAITFTAP
ncbi:hypothetical protein EP331_00465 [bacterium]|nr:MAG: hypothetical protein EP331_00465 [bacterium]